MFPTFWCNNCMHLVWSATMPLICCGECKASSGWQHPSLQNTSVLAAFTLEEAATIFNWCKKTPMANSLWYFAFIDANTKVERFDWTHDHLNSMWQNWVDIDEKWFFTMWRTKVKVSPNKLTPSRKVQSKHFSSKSCTSVWS